MVVTPNSRIRLLKSPIELDNKNQLTFSSEQNQRNYFLSLPYLEYDNCSYQRKDGVIRYETGNNPGEITYEDLLEYNYCMYQNEHYSNKWFYAFITEVKYINDGMTEIKIETDVMQSWKFEINYKASFIEREHVNDDTIGAHTIPENFELGEYVCSQAEVGTTFAESSNCYVCCGTISNYDDQAGSRTNSYYNSLFSGLIYYIFKDFFSVNTWLVEMDKASKGEHIQSIFMVPKSFFGSISWDTVGDWVGTGYKYVPVSNGAYNMGDFTINKPTTLANYTPVNNKLLTYPYCYLLGSNNNGTDIIYKYEDFSSSNMVFKIAGAICPGCSIKMLPRDYKNDNINYIEGLTVGKLPTCSWTTDVYINWLTQQAVNMPMQGFNIGAQLGSGNIIGGINELGNSINQIYQHELIPPQAKGNTNAGDLCFAYDKNDPTFYFMSIKEEYARIIDKTFSIYGYKVNNVKIPNLEGRTNWNYVKTIGLNITGNIPQEDMQKIKDIFNNGVTLWHNPSTFLDYSQSNNII